jgi:PelA/Pel-15E family pectate lyase
MTLPTRSPFSLKGLTVLYAVMAMSASLQAGVAWGKALKQAPAWYESDEAAKLADTILAYQHPSGGWPKNTDMSVPPPADYAAKLATSEKGEFAPTIDNGATTSQLEFLAKLISLRQEKRWLDSFNRGVDYLLVSQYENGGWPQFYPLRKGYYTHITFNDNAMVRVMRILGNVSKGQGNFSFTDAERRAKAAKAVDKGISCILACQIVVKGRKTVWCAQHDEVTFAPAQARKYELPSFSGAESIDIVQLLMEIEKPSKAVIEAVQGAVTWFEEHKISGIRLEKKPAPEMKGGHDLVVVQDPAAKDLYWARFYELSSGRPIFVGRDSQIHYAVSEIEAERRNGYAWYTTEARSLLDKQYPKWKARLGL